MVPFTETDELSRNCKYLFEVPIATNKKKALSLLYGTQEHDQVIYNQLATTSSSLKNVKFDAIRNTLLTARKSAYSTAAKYFDSMKELDHERYED